MEKLIQIFRSNKRVSFWRGLFVCWVIASVNNLAVPSSNPTASPDIDVPAFQPAQSTGTSLLESLLRIVISISTGTPDLASDTSEDTADKIEFVAHGVCSLNSVVLADDLQFVPLRESLLLTVLDKNTPPPKVS